MATIKIQGAYRAYLRRRWGRAEVQRHVVYAMRRYRAATLMQTLLRGRLGRRRSVTMCAVRICAWSHPSLLAMAVKGERHHRRRVFWYVLTTGLCPGSSWTGVWLSSMLSLPWTSSSLP
jgi:hypothetical protein